MLVVPEKDNGEKATSVSYEVAGQPSKNCYNLAKYDGSKHTSTEEEYYRKFRYNDWGGRRCPVCYPDEQYSDSDSESESDDSESGDLELNDSDLYEFKITETESTLPPSDDFNKTEITLPKQISDLALDKESSNTEISSTVSTSTQIQTVTLPPRIMSPNNTNFSSCCTN